MRYEFQIEKFTFYQLVIDIKLNLEGLRGEGNIKNTFYAAKILTICANMAIPLKDLKYPGSHAKPNIFYF